MREPRSSGTTTTNKQSFGAITYPAGFGLPGKLSSSGSGGLVIFYPIAGLLLLAAGLVMILPACLRSREESSVRF